jgi:alpha-beta hydrolase superfamily lysophospholipase
MHQNEKVKEGSFIKAADSKNIYVYCWDKVINPKGVIQIFHGMAEHAARYKDFANFLNNNGFIVYANDHRGHGQTVSTEDDLGYIGKDGFNIIVEDEYQIKKFIKQKYSKLPIIVLGHSFGSFIAQEYIIKYGNEINGVILSGSAARIGADVFAGRILSSIGKHILGEKKKARIINYFAFRGYNKGIKNPSSKNQWLSTDEDEVKRYDEDPFCGYVCTTGFYYYFFKGITKLYKTERLSKIPQKLPIFIISGAKDPVGNYGIWVKRLHDIYKNIQ